MSMQPNWETALDRYRIQTVILDRAQQAQFGRSLRTSADWMLVYEDPQERKFSRRKPKAESSAKPGDAKPTVCH